MRGMVMAAAMMLAGTAAAQQAPPPDYWPADGRLGLAAVVDRRGGGTCTLSFILLNASGTNWELIHAQMEVFTSRHHGTIADAWFRLSDNGRPREARAFVRNPCPARPRVVIRTLRCQQTGHPREDCLHLAATVTPPTRGERVRLTIADPWEGVLPGNPGEP